jgi:endonuclease/exonuclease/phosphatase family metal-dependent hydrolase
VGVLILSGFGALLFLEYNLFAHANTVARWVQVDCGLLAMLMPAATVVGLLIPDVKPAKGAAAAICQNVLILASVSSFLWVDGWASAALILVAQVCVILDLRLLFGFVASRTFKWKPSTVVALGLTLSLLLAFLLLLMYTFSFAYAYTLNVFRGTEPVPFFIATIILGLTSIFAAWKRARLETVSFDANWVKESLAVLPVVVAVVAFALQPAISPEPTEHGSVSVMTYNIHQAFGLDNKLDLQEIVDTVRRVDPDIMGLQEADAGRVPSLSVDQVLWLSRKLNMYSAYGPSWGSTYGVAVLSKYPIVEHHRYLLTSEEQQRACLETRIDVQGQNLSFFSVHLGLNVEERERQLDELLAYTVQAPAPQVLVGDFNANPDSHEVERVLDQFEDAFALGGTGSGYTSPADVPQETIDYVFVSPDIHVVSAQVTPSLASDHLPIVAYVEMGSS